MHRERKVLNYQRIIQSKYAILLFALISLLLAIPILDDSSFGKMIFSTFFLFIIAGILYGIRRSRHLIAYIIIALFVVAFHFTAIKVHQFNTVSYLLALIFYCYAIVVFSHDIFTTKSLTNDVLLGSICVYLLIGLSFATIYMLLQSFELGALMHQSTNLPIIFSADFYYFSFITLSTVGFGDIVVQSGFAKSIVMIESTVGIFYIAIMVARLVALFNR